MNTANIEAVRHFNRFYTKTIGTLNKGLAKSPFSLVEARVLYEIAHRTGPTANEIAQELALDPGYLSRILQAFVRSKLVIRKVSDSDRRKTWLLLTATGRKAMRQLETSTNEEIAALLNDLPSERQDELTRAMRAIESTLNRHGRREGNYHVRQHAPGDLGWIVSQHGRIYADEYGWDETFEAFVARIAADFIEHYDPGRERCWIAESAGQRLGSVMLVKHPEDSDRTAKLRLLLVTAEARGFGIGRRLVHECTHFAREAGYQKIILWTNDVLVAARHLYEAEGYRLIHEESHRSFGKKLVGQTWELSLITSRKNEST